MERMQYIRFIEPIMTPGRGGTNIGKAIAIELELDEHGDAILDEATGKPKTKPSTAPAHEQMDEIVVREHTTMIRNKHGVRITSTANLKDSEPLSPAQQRARFEPKKEPKK